MFFFTFFLFYKILLTLKTWTCKKQSATPTPKPSKNTLGLIIGHVKNVTSKFIIKLAFLYCVGFRCRIVWCTNLNETCRYTQKNIFSSYICFLKIFVWCLKILIYFITIKKNTKFKGYIYITLKRRVLFSRKNNYSAINSDCR